VYANGQALTGWAGFRCSIWPEEFAYVDTSEALCHGYNVSTADFLLMVDFVVGIEFLDAFFNIRYAESKFRQSAFANDTSTALERYDKITYTSNEVAVTAKLCTLIKLDRGNF